MRHVQDQLKQPSVGSAACWYSRISHSDTRPRRTRRSVCSSGAWCNGCTSWFGGIHAAANRSITARGVADVLIDLLTKRDVPGHIRCDTIPAWQDPKLEPNVLDPQLLLPSSRLVGLHPMKSTRPLPSGRIDPVAHALMVASLSDTPAPHRCRAHWPRSGFGASGHSLAGSRSADPRVP